MATSRKNAAVSNSEVIPVKELKPDKVPCAVVVKVLRKWDVYMKHSGNKPSSIELVLVDKEGSKIQAKIDKPYIYIHGESVKEGLVYNISNFALGLNYGQFRADESRVSLLMKSKFLHTLLPIQRIVFGRISTKTF